ncbi:cupin domain-containing protein [Rhodococcus wratislaviensis]|uniref:cupin domain-containing protein n=1 Tax=Rhodococcus wratislaviensis TaxID=44752 RepID=UPI00364C0D28
MTVEKISTNETSVQKYSVSFLDSLPWEPLTEFPDFTSLNGTPTMLIALVAGDGVNAGTIAAWSCDRDGFTYDKLPTPEAAFLLEGAARLTETQSGETVEVRAGEGYRIPAGWSGTWEAIEPVRKIYFML